MKRRLRVRQKARPQKKTAQPIHVMTRTMTILGEREVSNSAPTTMGEGTSPMRCMPTTASAIEIDRAAGGTAHKRTPLTGVRVANARICPTPISSRNHDQSSTQNARSVSGQHMKHSTVAESSAALITSPPIRRVVRSSATPPSIVPASPVTTARPPKTRSASWSRMWYTLCRNDGPHTAAAPIENVNAPYPRTAHTHTGSFTTTHTVSHAVITP
mmetsp:Transcript_41123/g.97427  ORF Transcript_41123/g.97427 Transcript_41123/m.97427 type:complete len:215 (+) Transcript_41123:196-840(+)